MRPQPIDNKEFFGHVSSYCQTRVKAQQYMGFATALPILRLLRLLYQ
jgi:hypothetical protein